MKKLLIILLFIISMFSCDELFNLEEDVGLNDEDIIKGLKTALQIGTDTAVAITSKTDGFYKDEVIKILLPPEADIIMKNKDHELLKAVGIDQKIEDFILRINRAAENASEKAKPIFINAITDMTIMDGFDILYGVNPLDSTVNNEDFDSTAATGYLKSKTYSDLYELFKPDVDNALNKDIVADISANDAWIALTDAYNDAVDLDFFGLLGGEKVTVELDDFVTTKALDGLFYKVGEEEMKIREDPYQWAVNIIQKVFGYVKDNPEG